MLQNAYSYYWQEKEVHSHLEKKIKTAFSSMRETSHHYNAHSRLAAYIIAVSHVAEAMKLRVRYY
jgi:glutamate dehydrogenase/leucine dehydrogenase